MEWNDWLSPELISQVADYAIRIIGVLALLVAARVVATWTGRLVVRGLQRSNFDETLTKFFGNLTRYAILTMAVLACLGVFGVQTTSFAAVIAAAGFAIGLAFQGTLGSFSAGVLLLTFRPFKVGDYVKLAGEEGTVEEIGLFVTAINTLDNRRIIVPNSEVAGGVIENMTAHRYRRVDVNVGTEYPADLREARAALQTVIDAEPARIETEDSHVYLLELGESSINWQVRVWVKPDDYWEVRERVTEGSKNALDRAGIGIPFPQMDVHLKQS